MALRTDPIIRNMTNLARRMNSKIFGHGLNVFEVIDT